MGAVCTRCWVGRQIEEETLESQLRAIFAQTAKAARIAQSELDARSRLLGRSYAIPRVSLSAKFSTLETQGRFAVVFGQKSEQEQDSQLNFSLNLAADPMPLETSSDAPLDTTVLLPPFLVTPEVRADVLKRLCVELGSIDRIRYRNELGEIESAEANRSEDPGIVVLALDRPRSYLLVRLGNANDGIFLLNLEDPEPLEVFSFAGMRERLIAWKPFRELFANLRKWQRQQFLGVECSSRSLPEKLGKIEIRAFATEMWEGFRSARRELTTADEVQEPSSYFHLQDVSAALSYSIPVPTRQGSESIPFVRTQTTISIDESDPGFPVMRVHLIAPEFVVVGDGRAALLELLRKNLEASSADSLWSVIDPTYKAAYQRAFTDERRRQDALALLSYRGMLPQNQFLFLWPASIRGEEREFAFSLRYEGSRLRDPELVLPLENPLGDFVSSSSLPEARDVQYDRYHSALHNFFHAVWVWHLSGTWI